MKLLMIFNIFNSLLFFNKLYYLRSIFIDKRKILNKSTS
nr:MAG TPA: hypothetical protein [Caudoviricetes sp.]